MKGFAAFLAIGLFLSCATPSRDGGGPRELKRLQVVAVTDTHGFLDPTVYFTKNQKPVETGGAALLSSYIRILRNRNRIPTVVVDAGDLFQGTLISNTVEGRPVVDFYNYLGVDAAAIGNHDFDFGPAGPDVVPRTPSEDPRGALKARIRQARFPFLSCNIREKSTGETPSWAIPSVLVNKSGVRVGIIGASTVSTPATTNIKNVADLDFIDPVRPIVREAASLRSRGADFVILAVHAGGGCTDNGVKREKDLSSCDRGELFGVLDRLPHGTVDLVIGGHTHKGIAKFYRGFPVLEAYFHTLDFGWAILSTDKKHPIDFRGLVEVCGSTVEAGASPRCDRASITGATSDPVRARFLGVTVKPDHEVVSLLKPDEERVAKIKAEPLGFTTTGEFVPGYYDESALGNMLVDVLARAYPRVDAVLINGGGLRAPLPRGPLTYGDFFKVLPFDNRAAVIRIDGATLLRLLEIGISRRDGGLFLSGVTMRADHCKVLSARIKGHPVVRNRTYTILTQDFLATGGAGLAALKLKPRQLTIWDDKPFVRDLVIAALRNWPGKNALRPSAFYDPEHPRYVIRSVCR